MFYGYMAFSLVVLMYAVLLFWTVFTKRGSRLLWTLGTPVSPESEVADTLAQSKHADTTDQIMIVEIGAPNNNSDTEINRRSSQFSNCDHDNASSSSSESHLQDSFGYSDSSVRTDQFGDSKHNDSES
jgi:hypothetical protein